MVVVSGGCSTLDDVPEVSLTSAEGTVTNTPTEAACGSLSPLFSLGSGRSQRLHDADEIFNNPRAVLHYRFWRTCCEINIIRSLPSP